MWGADEQRFVEAIAREAGCALETANLYEQAVAEKEKSEAILGRVADAVVVTDARGRIREWNQAAERTIGSPASEALGRSCAEVLALRTGERAFDCSQGCPLLATGPAADSILGQEVWRLREDGRRQPLLANVSVVSDREGNVSEVVHSIRDITRLKEADEAKTLFLATASHELKTPLTVIRGFAQLLSASRYANEQERDEALEAIERRSIQLSTIVDRLLLSSQIEAGRVRVLCGEVDVGPILEERVEALRRLAGRQVLVEVEPHLPAVLADADAVTTVVDHLLDNAVKYSPAGEPVVVRATSDQARLWVSVADSGLGMDAEQAARCFEKFWQAESSDARRYGGTGIGLYIVRSLVEAMGGEVRVESAPGVGSTFFVSLVRVGASPAEPAAEPTKRGAGEPSVIREFMKQIGIPARR